MVTNNELRVNVATPSFRNDHLLLESITTEIVLPLTEGEHTIETHSLPLGNSASNGDVEGQLSIWYRYEADKNILTFASTDLVTENTRPLWKVSTPLNEDIKSNLKTSLHTIQETLKQAALSKGIAVGMLTPVPQIGVELFKEHTGLTLESVWGGTVQFPMGTNFANVIGSTYDPRVPGYSSWINLWITQFGDPNGCTSRGFPENLTCDGPMVGGHCILGTIAQSVPSGSNDVFIVPICARHNRKDDIYMQIKYNGGNAIRLHNYMRS